MEPVEYSSQRILTTSQIAHAYGTNIRLVSNNFNRNKDRFTEGKHYYALEGEIKQEFLSNHHQIDDGSKHATTLYLWTEKGAWLLAKSINTDEAWQACEALVDDYYRKSEQLLATQQQIAALTEQLKQLPQGLGTIEIDEADTVVERSRQLLATVRTFLNEAGKKKRISATDSEDLSRLLLKLDGHLNQLYGTVQRDLERNDQLATIFLEQLPQLQKAQAQLLLK